MYTTTTDDQPVITVLDDRYSCTQTRGLSRGIKIVMDTHTILTMLMLVLNVMFLYMYTCRYMLHDSFVDALLNKNCIFRNIAERTTIAPNSL